MPVQAHSTPQANHLRVTQEVRSRTRREKFVAATQEVRNRTRRGKFVAVRNVGSSLPHATRKAHLPRGSARVANRDVKRVIDGVLRHRNAENLRWRFAQRRPTSQKQIESPVFQRERAGASRRDDVRFPGRWRATVASTRDSEKSQTARRAVQTSSEAAPPSLPARTRG